MRSKILKRAVWTTVGLVMFIAIGVALLPFHSMELSKVEVARQTSPNGKIDAVLVETNAGATTSFGYEVHVVTRGSKNLDNRAAYLYDATRSDSAYGVNLRWKEANVLVAQYLHAKRGKLERSKVCFNNESIQIVLQDGVVDNSAPPGGMEYNMRGRQ